MTELITTIQKVLTRTDLVLGWARDGMNGVASPARFFSPGEAEAAVFDSTCVHNLAVHLPRLKGEPVGIVAKGCDIRSIVQLIAEHEISRERITIIGVICPGMLDVKKIWRCYGFGAAIEENGADITVNGEKADRGAFTLPKCIGCSDIKPVMCDELVGDAEVMAPVAPDGPAGLEQKFAAMTPAERRGFWRQQFDRCIRCNACREACPLCFCRDVCTIQARDPHWVGGEVNAAEAEMAQHIRISHMAGRCTGCAECERACPVGIPLMLMLHEQNRATRELFGFEAGIDPGVKPPLQVFDIKADSWGDGQ